MSIFKKGKLKQEEYIKFFKPLTQEQKRKLQEQMLELQELQKLEKQILELQEASKKIQGSKTKNSRI